MAAHRPSVLIEEQLLVETKSRILPAHIEETLEAIARLQAEHREGAIPLQRILDRLTAGASNPFFVCFVLLLVAAWILLNLAMPRFGLAPIDEAPFNWLQGLVSLSSLVIASLILTTQRRDDELAGYREQLTLELSILGEQKTAKVIQLLEELRRDLPSVVNRVDHEATALARPSDPQAVLDAIKDLHADAED